MLPIHKIASLIGLVKPFLFDKNDKFSWRRALIVIAIALIGSIANHYGILSDLMQWLEFADGLVE